MATETQRHIWTTKEETQFVKDWNASESLGEMVEEYWDHSAFDDLKPQNEKEEDTQEKEFIMLGSTHSLTICENFINNLSIHILDFKALNPDVLTPPPEPG